MKFFGRPVPEQKGEFDKLIESIEQDVSLEHISEMVVLLEAAQNAIAYDSRGYRDNDDERNIHNVQKRIRTFLQKLDGEMKAELIKRTKLKD